MKHLIIYTHPNRDSFNNAIMRTLSERLLSLDQDVRVRDLYAMKFDPVIKQSDYDMLAHGEVPDDVVQEQEFIGWADIIYLICPIFWAGLPAMMKGYIERVFSQGFAYRLAEQGLEGLLGGKKAVIINTTGGSLKAYQASGMLESIKQTIDGGIFRFCNMKVISHKFFLNVPFSTEIERSRILEDIQDIARDTCYIRAQDE